MLPATCGDDGLGAESVAAVEHDARCGRRRTALGYVGGACETLLHKWVTSVDIAPVSLAFETHTEFDGKRHARATTVAEYARLPPDPEPLVTGELLGRTDA
jgi:hypothetical protein